MSEMVKVTVEVRKDHYNTLKYGVKHWPENYDENEKAIANGTEVKQGHWIILKDKYGDVVEAVCSCCDKNGNHKWTYCPYCGMRMEVSE